MLYLIGLGLCDEKDITVAGLEVVKRASRVYLEAYTSILMISKEKLELFYGRPVLLADRETIELHSDTLLRDAQTSDIALLIVGDPFSATTHTDLLLRARALQVPTRTLHNASVTSAIAACGLQLYNFGQTVSMVFFTDAWRPMRSFYDRVRENRDVGLHTLVLLDIKVKEESIEDVAMGRSRKGEYLPPRYMRVGECAMQMLEIEEELKGGVYSPESLAIGVARLGSPDQKFVAGTLRELASGGADLGPPLHSLVLLGKRVHELEVEFIREFAVDVGTFDRACGAGYGTL